MSLLTKKQPTNWTEYQGEDRVVSSAELQARFATEPPCLFELSSGIPTLDEYVEKFRDGELITISGYTKNGKCHGRGTKVLMFDGSVKKVEDVVRGDKLMGDDSTPRTVLATNTGYGEMFRVSPNAGGGDFTCNADHILCLKRIRRNHLKPDRKAGSILEVPLSEYLNLSVSMAHILKAYRVPVKFPETELPIDPYFLGVWLGDGTSSQPSITTADEVIVDYLHSFAKKYGMEVRKKEQLNNKSSVYRICEKTHTNTSRLIEAMKEIGVLNNKHIPLQYKANSLRNRMELLAGLVDTDGYANSRGTLGKCVAITIKNKTLAEDIDYLAKSLGFSSSVREAKKKCHNNGKIGTYWTVAINGDTASIPCRLSRKLIGSYKCKKDVLRFGFKVHPIGSDRYYGFQIDGNGRYLLADFQVTHNTLLAQTLTKQFANAQHFSLWFTYEVPVKQFLSQFPKTPLIYMPAMLKAHDMNWVEDRIRESCAKFETRIVFIDHLHFLFDMARARNTSLEIGTVVRRLKQIANSGFLVFLLCHTSKGKSEGDPSYEAIRDSSLIAQESDSVFMVKRTPEDGENAARMRVEFHRRTGVMEKVVNLIKQNGYLYERASDEQRAEDDCRRYGR